MDTILIHTINLFILGFTLLMVCISHVHLEYKVERLKKQIQNLALKTPSLSTPSDVTPFVNIV